MTDPIAVAAQNPRTILAEIEAGELDCTRAQRNRLEGACVALKEITQLASPESSATRSTW